MICRFGYMLMPDPPAALAETRRVLKPGGRLTLAVWREADRNPWVSIVGRLLLERGHVPPPEPGAPGMFTMARDERIRELLESAGFDVLRIEEVPSSSNTRASTNTSTARGTRAASLPEFGAKSPHRSARR